MSEEPAARYRTLLDRRHLLVDLSVVAMAVVLVVSVDRVRTPAPTVEVGAPQGQVGVTRFAEGRVDIRSGPGFEHGAINFLSDAQEVLVGEPDENGWVAVVDPVGDTIGFVVWASLSDYPPMRSGRHFELEGLVVPVR